MKRKIGTIFGATLIALLALSVSYALWSQALVITGTVYTGELDAKIMCHGSWDSEPEIKDYSWVSCENVDDYTLEITVNNAYPSIDYCCLVQIQNTGTIPWRIWNPVLSGGNLTDVGTVVFVTWADFIAANPNFPVPHDVGVKLNITEGEQVHPEDSAWGVLCIHLTNDAEELATYTFDFTVTVVQWNEYDMLVN